MLNIIITSLLYATIPNCEKYKASSGIRYICLQCKFPYMGTNCEKCLTGYEMKDNKCEPICIDNCDYCINPTTCSTCKQQFKGQYCEECNIGFIQDDEYKCIYENCAVDNCLKCSSENECIKCQKGFNLTDNQCVDCLGNYKKIVNESGIFCTQTCEVDHCYECTGSKNYCKTCEASFINYYGDCVCEKGYHLVESKCEKILCPSLDHCSLCESENKCSKCETGYRLNSAKTCNLCDIEYEQDPESEEFKCRKADCSHIQHCTKCKTSYECHTCEESFDGSLCSICAKGFQPFVSDGELFCIEGDSCNDKIKNCIVCQSDTECHQCQLPYTGPNCDECIYGYKKDDEKCTPILQKSYKPPVQIQMDNSSIKIEDKITKVNATSLTNLDKNNFHTLEIRSDITQVHVTNPNNASVMIKINDYAMNEIFIKPETSDTKMSITSNSISPNGGNIKLSNSDNIDIYADKRLNLIADKKINVNKIIVSGDYIELNSNAAINVNELNINGRTIVNHATTESNSYSINRIVVNENSAFTPRNLTIKDIEIDFKGVFLVDDTNNLLESNITINYDEKSNVETYPIEIRGEFKGKINAIKIQNINNLKLEDASNKDLVIASAENQEKYIKICKELESVFIGDMLYKNATCKNVEINGHEYIQLIALDETTKNGHDKKKGLSGGAIAGIVIGVLAAVAIAGVLIYLFVFKKIQVGAASEEEEN